MSTTFPNATQSFKTWEDLTSVQLNAYIQYLNYLNQGKWTEARNIFERGGLSQNMLPTAADFNTMCDTILECMALYQAQTTSAKGIQDFMAQFAYRGIWDANNINQYKKFTIIKYNSSIGTYLYIANADITTTSNPYTNSTTSSPQWLRLCPVSWTNTASNYRGVYESGTTYYTGDVVVKDESLQIATVNNGVITWTTLFDFNALIVEYSSTQPAMSTGGIWFRKLS